MNNKTKFTPAPWSFGVQNGHCGISINCKDNSQLATVYLGLVTSNADWGKPHFELPENKQSVANAHLIAAAPEMYDLLATIENDDNQVPAWLWDRIKTTLAKARGEIND